MQEFRDPAPTMLNQALILTSHRDYAQAMRAGLLSLGDARTRVDVELDALRALSLAPREYELILVDLRLKAMDGLQLLALLKPQAPDTRFVVVGDAGSETFSEQARRAGADLFLLRPDSPPARQAALAQIAELLDSARPATAPAEEEAGPLLRIADLIQERCREGDSALLHLRSGPRTGAIFLHRGEVFHAQCPGKSGKAAFDEMLAWDDGVARIKTLKIQHVPPRTIEIPCRELLGHVPPGAKLPDLPAPGGRLFMVSNERPLDAALPEIPTATAPRLAGTGARSEDGTELPPLNSHWKVNLMGELVEGSQVSEPDRCAFITYFIYRKLADVAVALEVDYFNEMTLWGPHLQQVLVADNLGVRHAVFETARTDENQREQYMKWCREQSF